MPFLRASCVDRSGRTLWAPLAFVLALGILGRPAEARNINYSCPVFSVLKDSTGQALPADFIWELGAFRGNFTPTAANGDQWSSNWVPLGRTLTNEAFGFFSREVALTSNAAPFATGNRGWIWGYNCSSDPGEWVLIGSASWTWPTVNPLAVPLFWSTDDLTVTAIVGTHNATAVNPATHIQAHAIADALPPQMTAADWRGLEFEGELTDPLTGLDADYDGDGVVNLLEFALGTSAREAGDHALPTFRFQSVAGSDYALLSVPRNPCANATYTIQRADNLAEWVTTGLAVFADEPDLIEVRETTPQTLVTPARGFLRLQVTP